MTQIAVNYDANLKNGVSNIVILTAVQIHICLSLMSKGEVCLEIAICHSNP